MEEPPPRPAPIAFHLLALASEAARASVRDTCVGALPMSKSTSVCMVDFFTVSKCCACCAYSMLSVGERS